MKEETYKIQIKYYKNTTKMFAVGATSLAFLLFAYVSCIERYINLGIILALISALLWIIGVIKWYQVIVFYKKNKEAIKQKW